MSNKKKNSASINRVVEGFVSAFHIFNWSRGEEYDFIAYDVIFPFQFSYKTYTINLPNNGQS